MADAGAQAGCAACGEPGKLRCSGCAGATRYCSAACQRKHWPTHKPVCRAAGAATAAKVAAPAAASGSGSTPQIPAAPLPDPFDGVPEGEPIGALWPAARRRAWEDAVVGADAPALVARAPTLQALVDALPGRPVRYADVPGKGRGLLAARDFLAGQTIMTERAVLWFPHWQLADADGATDMVRVAAAHRPHVEGLLLQLAPFMVDSPQKARVFAGDADMRTLTRSQLISSVAVESAFGVRVEGSKTWAPQPSATALPAAAAAAAADGSDGSPQLCGTGTGTDPAHALPPHLRTIDAVCPVTSLVNHDCAPNAAWLAHGPRDVGQPVAVRLVAQRTIKAGAEISIAYKPSTGSPRSSRAAELQAQYGFACGCGRCTAPADDTVGFTCARCGSGPARLYGVPPTDKVARSSAGYKAAAAASPGAEGGVMVAVCSACGSFDPLDLPPGDKFAVSPPPPPPPPSDGAADSGSAAGATGRPAAAVVPAYLPAPAVQRLMAARTAAADALVAVASASGTPAAPPARHPLLHVSDVALFEACYNALVGLLSSPGAPAAYAAAAPALLRLSRYVLSFLEHAGGGAGGAGDGYLENLKRKRILRDAALGLCAAVAGKDAGGAAAGTGGGDSGSADAAAAAGAASVAASRDASTDVRMIVPALLLRAAEVEAVETGADGRRAALLRSLAEHPPAPDGVKAALEALTTSAL